MSRGVQWSLSGSVAFVALITVAGCSHFWVGEREAWRRDAEVACLKSGAVKETPERVRISAISGPGMCGADFPIRVSALGESAPLSYDDEPMRPPGAIRGTPLPQHWPVAQPVMPLPPPSNAGAPLSLNPPGVSDMVDEDEADFSPTPPRPYSSTPGAQPMPPYAPRPNFSAAPPPSAPAPLPAPLGAGGGVTALAGGVGVKPPAVLACPIVARLDQWINDAVQPAAMRWFRQPVVEIKQISAYSCRGMNGNPSAHISEHAFGNALDIAEFYLADGRKVSVQYGWHGAPEEQAFLHDVQAAACQAFSTVLAPGANIYHYNHIHVDLMRHYGDRHICEPTAIPGEAVAERARARYAAQHHGDPSVTGAIRNRLPRRALGYSGEDNDKLPLALPGED